MAMRHWAMILALGLLPGCADFPEVEAALAAEGTPSAFPALLPMDTLLDRADSVTISADIGAGVSDRVAALRRKADRLRGPVLSRSERRRLQQAAARHAQ
ncbi:hypothetical protein [Actibacterium ureilyticum]|uniref:hypothetical protein n=1 Tax=Actibacterium ureilyticum TaxID=1590614 RepID=UPI000BAB0101|nr:hypothetical protein [Actibacterium ureilyticum]